jgi:hypothetical protein
LELVEVVEVVEVVEDAVPIVDLVGFLQFEAKGVTTVKGAEHQPRKSRNEDDVPEHSEKKKEKKRHN